MGIQRDSHLHGHPEQRQGEHSKLDPIGPLHPWPCQGKSPHKLSQPPWILVPGLRTVRRGRCQRSDARNGTCALCGTLSNWALGLATAKLPWPRDIHGASLWADAVGCWGLSLLSLDGYTPVLRALNQPVSG
eukprot:6087345-Amphidinium_carterae.1